MLLALLAEAPVEVSLSPLVAVKTPEVVRVSMTCRQLQRLFVRNDALESLAVAVLAVLAREALLPSEHWNPPDTVGIVTASIHLHQLGLSMQRCSAYCKAMRRVTVPQPLRFTCVEEVDALITARNKLLHTEATSKRGSVVVLGPPVGSLKLTSGVETLATFTFDAPQGVELTSGGILYSQWQWVDVPQAASQPTFVNVPAALSPIQVGFRLQVGYGSARCVPPEIQCVVRTPTTSWLHLEAVSATPGVDFACGLAAGGFKSYGDEEDSWYYPREECSWKDGFERVEDDHAQCCLNSDSDGGEDSSGEAEELPSTMRALVRVSLTVRVVDYNITRRPSASRLSGHFGTAALQVA